MEEPLLPLSTSAAGEPEAAAVPIDDALARYARLAVLLSLSLAGYVFARFLALVGLPPDAWTGEWDGGTVAADLWQLALLTCLLAALTDLTASARYAWFAQRPAYLLLFFATLPTFAGLGMLPGLQVSLGDVSEWGLPAWVAMLHALGLSAFLVFWHARHAVRELQPRERTAYLASRAALHAAWLSLWLVVRLSASGLRRDVHFHLHHTFIGLLLASWAAFNARPSAALLAIGAALMVGGVASYHYAWISYYTTEGAERANAAAGCVTWAGNATSVDCRWRGDSSLGNWSIIACPQRWASDRPTGTCAAGA